jgi:hypothetical protein
MKIQHATHAKSNKPFVNDGKLSITTVEENDRIVAYDVTYGSEQKRFPVKGKFKILEAWKEVEAWLDSRLEYK